MRDTEVLIVGAGPTGLVLAIWLTRLGVRVRIVDKAAAPGTSSRALAVHARTLECMARSASPMRWSRRAADDLDQSLGGWQTGGARA